MREVPPLRSKCQEVAISTSIGAEGGRLEETLVALGRVGGHVRQLTVSSDGVERTTASSAVLRVISCCPGIVGIRLPPDAQLALGLHGGRISALELHYGSDAARDPMASLLAATSVPSLRSIALDHFATSASKAWALFSSLSHTAIERVSLIRCCVNVVDIDVDAYAGENRIASELLSMASEGSDGMAAIVLAHFVVGWVGLTGGASDIPGSADDQPQPRARLLADDGIELLVIDHFMTAHVPVLAESKSISRLCVQIRSSPEDFELLEVLDRCFTGPGATQSAAAGSFPALRVLYIQRDLPDTSVRPGDISLSETERAALEGEVTALELKSRIELERRDTATGRRWDARFSSSDQAAYMTGLIRCGLGVYVRTAAFDCADGRRSSTTPTSSTGRDEEELARATAGGWFRWISGGSCRRGYRQS